MALSGESLSGESLTGPVLAHHFDNIEQQRLAARLGIWTFLITEIMLFGGLFTTYAIYRMIHADVFVIASRELDVLAGAINTGVLITSSFTMALAVRAAGLNRRKQTFLFLALTIFIGCIFLGIKFYEYAHKAHEGLVPGASFVLSPIGLRSPGGQLFFALYFVMTGTHAVHMVIGIVIMLVMAIHMLRVRHVEAHAHRVEILGLYWHFVDIVWVFLFPLLYLLGRHG